VWKTILPIGSKRNQFGKWSPNWDGPYKVIKVMSDNSYLLEILQGERLKVAFNGRYLKSIFKVFGKKPKCSLSNGRYMYRPYNKIANVYIALSHHVADDMGIIAVWFNYVCLIKCFLVHAS
jgi:hypothetical protein